MSFIIYSVIVVASLVGLVLSFYIHQKKCSHGPMICPLKGDCKAVIQSDYGRFFGIGTEYFGFLYYGAMFIGYAWLVFYSAAVPSLVRFGLFAMSVLAFLFSLYLVFIQAFVLKKWCTWCLCSALLCALMAVLSLFLVRADLMEWLVAYQPFIVWIHVAGFALGVGGTTIADVLFFKFLKDLRISEWEADVLHVLSQVIWFALAVLFISGVGLYLPLADALNHSDKFLVKVIVVGVILVNGLFLNLLIAPRLVKISFGKKHEHEPGELYHMRRLAFALGAISLVSWYTAFTLGMLKFSVLPLRWLLFVYGAVLVCAIAISQFFEWRLGKNSSLF